MNCTNCGKELIEGSKFCFECGAKVGTSIQDDNMVLVCSNCGIPPKEGKKFCVKCGANVSETGIMKKKEDIVQPQQMQELKVDIQRNLSKSNPFIYDGKRIWIEIKLIGGDALFIDGEEIANSGKFFSNPFASQKTPIIVVEYPFSTGMKTIHVFAKDHFDGTFEYKIYINGELLAHGEI